MRPAELLAARARKHGGVFTLDDALAVGLTVTDVRRMLDQGWWTVLHPQVYAAQSTPVTTAVREAAALAHLGNRACLSHFSAAQHQRLDTVHLVEGRVWATVPVAVVVIKRPGLEVLRTRRFPQVEQLDGLACTVVPRTVVDLAARLDRPSLSTLLADAVRSRRTTVERVTAMAADFGGRPGLADLRRVCDEFDPLFDSQLEEEALPHLQGAAPGEELERQVEVLDASGRFVARVDFLLRRLRLVIEIDGFAHHSSPSARNRDARRDRRLTALGYVVVRFTTDDVRRHPARVRAELAEVMGRLMRRTA
jgi:very-short-patch-repair endonuclease